jgi:uncharacterized protein YqgQ
MIEMMENNSTSVFSNEIFEIEDVYLGCGVVANFQMKVEAKKDIYLKKAIKSIEQV